MAFWKAADQLFITIGALADRQNRLIRVKAHAADRAVLAEAVLRSLTVDKPLVNVALQALQQSSSCPLATSRVSCRPLQDCVH
jgi:hypothetical protein